MAETSTRCSTPRWKPTTQQLQILEELYKRTKRSPSAEEIHQIAGFVRRYGEIEAKNVFYWFQNRKGSDRINKRRKQEEAMASVKQKHTTTETGAPIVGWPCETTNSVGANSMSITLELMKLSRKDEEFKTRDQLNNNGGEGRGDSPADANNRKRNRGWAVARIETTSKAVGSPQYNSAGELGNVKALQTLQLFPLKPRDIRLERISGAVGF